MRKGSTRQWRKLRAAWWPAVATGKIICPRCGEPINPETDKWHLGHKIAHAAGGLDTPDNVQPEHAACNIAAGTKSSIPTPPAFRWPGDEPDEPKPGEFRW